MKYEILGLGPTETEVMEALWVHGPLTVKQVHAKIEAYRLIAYTTILTVSARMEEIRKPRICYDRRSWLFGRTQT
jgi:predicted transcriptional regulator